MTQDEVMEIAKEVYGETVWSEASLARLQQFVNLVAAKEREVIIQIIKETPFSNWFQADLIEAIQARGEA